MMNSKMVISLITAYLLLGTTVKPLLSTQCKTFCPEYALRHRGVIFAGYVLEVGEPVKLETGSWGGVIPITYRVSAIWKGPLASEFTVYVDEYKLRNQHYRRGQHHFVVPWQPKAGPFAGELRISTCTRAKLVTHAIVERFLLPDPIYETDEYSQLPNVTLADYYELLADPDFEVSSGAAVGARCLRAYSDEMAPDLIAMLRNPNDARPLAVVGALVSLGKAEFAIPTFEWAFNSDEPELRLAGFWGFRGAFTDPVLLLPYLFTALEDPDAGLRFAAVNTLNNWQAMGDRYDDACCSAKEALFVATQAETDATLREWTARVFERIDSEVPCI